MKKGETLGFLTVGHAIPSVNPDENIVFYRKKPVGVCKQIQNSGIADAAFCELTEPRFVITNNISGTELELDTETTEAIVGEEVHMKGFKSESSGKVVSNNFSILVKGNYFYNLVKASYSSMVGDSGGIVYIYNPDKNKCYTVGIQKGTFTNETMSLYSKADSVLKIFGVERY